MDGVSAAATIITLVDIAAKIGKALKEYHDDVRDAREDIRKLYGSIQSLKSLLEQIIDFQPHQTHFRHDSGPLSQAQEELERLSQKVQVLPKDQRRRDKVYQSLKWPLDKSYVEKALVNIERAKSSLGLEIGLQHLNLQIEHFDICLDIINEIKDAQRDKQKCEIDTWLSRGVADPSTEHNIARDKHEETTGSWLLDSDKFREWLEQENSFLWINGGAIEHVQARCVGNPYSVVTYWYFSFSDSEKQKLYPCLCSIIAGIFSKRRDIPTTLWMEYERSNRGQLKPSLKSLISMLKEVTEGFDDIYIVLDALDEFPRSNDGKGRNELLKCIHKIRGLQIKSLHFLVTSRKEADILKSFGSFAAIDAAGAYVEADIRKYIDQRLQEEEFSQWKAPLKQEVRESLATRAEGMFRLVALQLDSLSTLRSASNVRTALLKLPRTLDSFYERMLLDINESDKELARRALGWVSFAARPLTLCELAEAAVANPEEPGLDLENGFFEPEVILSILPAGLIQVYHEQRGLGHSKGQIRDSADTSSKGMVQFSHFSVKEYITSYHDLGSTASFYYALPMPTHNFIAKICLAYMLWVGSRIPEVTNESHTQFPLLDYSARCWQYHINFLEQEQNEHTMDKDFVALAMKFLCYGSAAMSVWQSVIFEACRWLSDRRNHEFFSALKPFYRSYFWEDEKMGCNIHPVVLVSALGFRNLLAVLLQSHPNLDELPKDDVLGTSLHAASLFRNYDVVKQLIAGGANVNLEGGKYGFPLIASCVYGDCNITRLLLDRGASIEAKNQNGHTALLTAVNEEHDDIAKLLIQRGAAVNGTREDEHSALTIACGKKRLDIAQLLIQQGADIEWGGTKFGTPLYAMTTQFPVVNPLEAMMLLIQNGAKVDNLGGQYGTPLQSASFYVKPQRVQFLLDSGALVNCQGGDYGTALQLACCNGHKDAVVLFLNAGADVNIRGKFETAFHAAVLSYNTEIVELLLADAKINISREQWENLCETLREEIELDLLILDKLESHNVDEPNKIDPILRGILPEYAFCSQNSQFHLDREQEERNWNAWRRRHTLLALHAWAHTEPDKDCPSFNKYFNYYSKKCYIYEIVHAQCKDLKNCGSAYKHLFHPDSSQQTLETAATESEEKE
ncbi:hypothetical protein HYFRA_00003876 [Hymenoscyphus fraxineus]|uniref:Nephrocystin 3-like N-terminal domain-containing protein n=1 Tax=Hymenoscyphus fraxineus TaxID=746836 RepID=A0A9N9L2G0_9HELO|nr:hypothetical protein HYFRA_00003876 [Hymenoscyphus fraxineus]